MCHHLAYRAIQVRLEHQVAVRQYSDQIPGRVHDRHAADRELAHQNRGIAQPRIRTQGDRVHDHAALRALHPVHLGALRVDRHVLVDDPDPSVTRHGDRHPVFRHRVHGRRNERGSKMDATRKARPDRHVGGVNPRVVWHEEHIVEGQSLSNRRLLHDGRPVNLAP